MIANDRSKLYKNLQRMSALGIFVPIAIAFGIINWLRIIFVSGYFELELLALLDGNTHIVNQWSSI